LPNVVAGVVGSEHKHEHEQAGKNCMQAGTCIAAAVGVASMVGVA